MARHKDQKVYKVSRLSNAIDIKMVFMLNVIILGCLLYLIMK